MRLAVVIALQLCDTFSHFTDSAVLPPLHPAARDQGHFGENTKVFRVQGRCRLFLDPSNTSSLSFTTGISDVPTYTDPEGDTCSLGECACNGKKRPVLEAVEEAAAPVEKVVRVLLAEVLRRAAVGVVGLQVALSQLHFQTSRAVNLPSQAHRILQPQRITSKNPAQRPKKGTNEGQASKAPNTDQKATQAAKSRKKSDNKIPNPSVSLRVSPSLNSGQPLRSSALDDDPKATLPQTLADDPTATSTQTLGAKSIAIPSQTLIGQNTATNSEVSVKAEDSSVVVDTTPLLTATGIVSSWETDGTPVPTTLDVSAVPQSTSPVPPEATFKCPLKATAGNGTKLVKRTGAPPTDGGAGLRMKIIPRAGGTYAGFVPFQHLLDCAELRDYAEAGYNQIITHPDLANGVIIVSALWIRGVGVVVASKPRAGAGRSDDDVAGYFNHQAQSWFPVYYNLIRNRYHLDRPGEIDKWHAEDVALIWGATELYNDQSARHSEYTPSRLRTFNWNADILAYGKYRTGDEAGFKPPCGYLNVAGAHMLPSCASVLADLRVRYVPTPWNPDIWAIPSRPPYRGPRSGSRL
ncbi:MAG: hypothetical protein Q9218_007767 [Villophora microphyllina]